MPYRSITAWVVVLGVLAMAAVAMLAICGVDLRRAAMTGSRWKRAPLSASLLLLGLLGIEGVAGTAGCPSPTCYYPAPGVEMNRTDFLEKLDQLDRQLPLLEKYAREEKIDPDVVRKLLDTAEEDVRLLETEFAGKELPPPQHAHAMAQCARARTALKSLRHRVGYGANGLLFPGQNKKTSEGQPKPKSDEAR